MKSKNIGFILLALTVLLSVIFITVIADLKAEGKAIGCFPNAGCEVIQTKLSLSHFAFGVLGFFFAFGLFLAFFSRDDEKIMQRLEREKDSKVAEQKFAIALKMLDSNQQKILQLIRAEHGISQSSIVLKSGLSKSLVSEILSGFESKNLIKRQVKGKTRLVFLIENF